MKSILIRAEDKNQWESRAPLIPGDLKEIMKQTGVRTFIQSSPKRFFEDEQYASAGAEIQETMSSGDIILGVKEIPEEKLLDNKIYMFFSHTIKAQSANMPMLKKIINGGSTLIDYEKVVDADNRRLIYFGRYAGDAGAIDILWLMGKHWLWEGTQTPFSEVKQAKDYHSVAEAQDHMKEIGEAIRKKGLPQSIFPMVIGILGYGNVSNGAQQIFECLPVKRILPEELQTLSENGRGDNKTVYLTIFKEEHLVTSKYGHAFNLQDYYQNPENYVSQFEPYLPFVTILVNAVYWESKYPKFVTWKSLRNLFGNSEKPKLKGIADITCDVNGSIECNVKSTTTGMPSYICDPMTKSVIDGYKGKGLLVLAVDNLPCELPNDSSSFFSAQLRTFIPNLLSTDFSKSLENSGLRPELQKATIVYRGKLTPAYRYLEKFLP